MFVPNPISLLVMVSLYHASEFSFISIAFNIFILRNNEERIFVLVSSMTTLVLLYIGSLVLSRILVGEAA